MDPMEPRPFLHNSHNRYTHDSLPPFPAPSFSGDRNFYQIHHHHLPPPPPPPPPLHLQPPPPPLHPPLPPYPPTYHHHRPSKFNFLNSHHPIEDDPRKSVFNINYHPRVPDRIVFDQPRSVPHHPATFPEDLPRMPRPEFGDTHLDSRQNFCDPFRVHADNRPARLFHETHPHPFDHHPMSPFRSAPSGSFLGQERFEDDLEISRLLGFSRDGFDQHRKEELFRGQNDGLSNDDYHCRGLVLEPPPSSNNFRMAASGEPRSHSGFFSDNERPWDDGIRDNVDDNQVWGATRLSPGELRHSPVEIENGERIRDGEFRLASGKRMTHFSKLGKLKNRLRGDGNQEFMRTPRKKPQKTSALLRIGKHAPRKRNDEQLYVSAYFNDSNSGPFRGKGHLRQEKGREGSPVELDVTFKSNALVAKAIGPSSPFPGSVGDPSFRNKIFRKSVVPVLGSSSSDPAEFHVGSVNGVSASLDMGTASSSDKVPMQSEDGTVVSGIGIVSDSSPPLTYPVIPLPGNNTVEGSLNSMVSVGSATSDKKSSLKTRKKRKRLFGLSTSPITGIHDVRINANPSNQGLYAASNSENVIAQLAQENIFCGIESADVLLKDSAAELSSNAAVSISVGDDTNPNGTTSGKGLTHSEEKVTESGLGAPDDVGWHRCPDGAFKLLEDNAVQGSPPAMVSVEVASVIGSMGSDTPSLKIKRKRKVMTSPLDIPISREDEIPAGPMNGSSSKHSMGTALCPDKDPTQADNNVPISGNDTVAPLPCPSEVAIPLGNTSVEVSTEAEGTVGSGIIVCSEGMCTPKAKQKMKLTSPLSALSSPLVSEIQEGSLDPDRSIYDANVPCGLSKCLTRAEEKVAFSVTGSVHDVALPCLDGTTISLKNSVVELSPKLTFLVREGSNVDYTSKLENACMISSSVSEDSAIPDMRSPCSSGCRGEKQDVIPITDATNYQENGSNFHSLHMETGNVREERVEVTAAEVPDTICRETCDDGTALESYTQEKIESVPLEPRALDLADRLSSKNMECTDYNLRHEGEFPSLFGHSSKKTQVSGTPTDSNEKLIESVPDTLPNVGSLESFSMSPGLHILNGYTSNEHVSVDRTRVDEEPIVRDGFLSTSNNSHPVEPIINVKSDHRVQSGLSIPKKAAPTPLGSLQDTKQDKPSLKSMSKDSNVKKNHQSYAIPGVFPGRSSLASGSLKKAASSTHIVKPRTWHRTENSASPFSANYSCSSTGISQRQSPKKFAKAQSSSYIRKGNSLVRKSAPVVASSQGPTGLISTSHQLNPVTINESKVSIDTLNCSRTNGEDPLSERPKTPPLPCNTKSPNCTANSFKGCMPPTLGNHSCKGASETVPDPLRHTDSKDAAKPDGSSESQAGISKSIEIQSFLNDRSSNSLNMKRMIYVKRKSNQLVAASSPEICDPSVHVAEKNQAIGSSLSSDHYYKRKKNQLILTSSENHLKNAVAIPDDNSNSDGQMASNVSSLNCSRNLSRQKPNKALRKGCKPSKFSLVWKLHDTKSQNNDSNSLQHRKVLPYLFPWKRSASWRHFIYNTASVSKNSSLSLISRLMLSRKINTVYARSTGGFSLRKSKVLSVGGSNLKWSKSIERRSKKVNEEATRAVAAVERKKREQKVASCATADAKHRRHQSSRERIFRIGSVRYKMDSSKRTLQRIPDERSSGAIDFQSENGTKKSFVPRRLLIGNDEYVRLGNGNQLIRDPKKLTRILASEKVRWSLHTARLRLARKQKYCQFFTRFGKCNKDEGKCPYIHDPSKIAVCTKFLKGLCSNANCKLTHKVIPERMQDCSYFLRGLCTNQSCPYRHVNVNPNACVCEGFLRGYCADGDECRKKHSYVCPIYGATGVCPQGSLCKLHHPKNRNKGKKRKRSKEQKNTRGRYFGSKLVDIPDSRAAVAEEHTTRNQEDIFFHEGRFADYISLDVSDEEAKETNDPTNTRTSDSDPSDLQLDDIDEIIKPVLIMKLQ